MILFSSSQMQFTSSLYDTCNLVLSIMSSSVVESRYNVFWTFSYSQSFILAVFQEDFLLFAEIDAILQILGKVSNVLLLLLFFCFLFFFFSIFHLYFVVYLLTTVVGMTFRRDLSSLELHLLRSILLHQQQNGLCVKALDKCYNIIIFIFYCFQLNANPSLIQDGVPDMFTLTLSSVKVGFCLQLRNLLRDMNQSVVQATQENRIEQTTDWNVSVLLYSQCFRHLFTSCFAQCFFRACVVAMVTAPYRLRGPFNI